MPSQDPDEAPKPRRRWLHRKRWWLAGSLLIAILGVNWWHLFRSPEVVFLGFREKNGRQMAAFAIKGMRGGEGSYVYITSTVEAERGDVWFGPDISARDTAFSIQTRKPNGEPLTERFRIRVDYVKVYPEWMRAFRKWLPRSVSIAESGEIWSEWITL